MQRPLGQGFQECFPTPNSEETTNSQVYIARCAYKSLKVCEHSFLKLRPAFTMRTALSVAIVWLLGVPTFGCQHLQRNLLTSGFELMTGVELIASAAQIEIAISENQLGCRKRSQSKSRRVHDIVFVKLDVNCYDKSPWLLAG